MRALRTTAFIAIAVSLAACSHTAAYNSSYFKYSPQPVADKLPGTAAIQMSATDQAEVYTGKPSGFTGSATTLSLPIGQISREAATLAFREKFAGGAEATEKADPAKGYAAIISPKVHNFSYEYSQLKNLGFAITPIASVTVETRILDSKGNTITTKVVDSGEYAGETYFMTGTPGEEISKTAHAAILKTMQEAASATYDALKKAVAQSMPDKQGEAL